MGHVLQAMLRDVWRRALVWLFPERQLQPQRVPVRVDPEIRVPHR